MIDLDFRWLQKDEDISAKNLDFSKKMRMSHASGCRRSWPDPPRRTLQNPRAPLAPSKKKVFKNLVTSKLLFRDLVWLYLWLFFFVSSMAPIFEVIIFLLFEPLGVDFELSS